MPMREDGTNSTEEGVLVLALENTVLVVVSAADDKRDPKEPR